MEPIKEICKILQKQLDLTDKQIWIYNQKRDIPNDFGVYYVVNYLGQRIIGNVRKEFESNQGLIDYQNGKGYSYDEIYRHHLILFKTLIDFN